ncbi:MAG: glycoside hydrolase family 65 protein [Ignavibacteria bacterium]|jgi:trehalose/maltose hydrolase-like predicted phosphorylase|nr:glycoside hydrolase family 65 protein [Ignavibacteria bacterium]
MKHLRIFLFMVIFSASAAIAQDESFILQARHFRPYFPTYIGNGYFSLSSTPIGTQQAESFMVKVYDHGKDDIPRIACLPAWNEIDFYNGTKWLNDPANDSTQFSDYSQTLNMYNGTLETRYTWNSNKKKTAIDIISLISRSQKNLALMELNITPDFSGTVKLVFPLKQRQEPKRAALAKLTNIAPVVEGTWPPFWYPGYMKVLSTASENDKNSGRMQILSQSDGKDTRVAISAEVTFDQLSSPVIVSRKGNNSASVEISFKAVKGQKYTFYKFVSVESDRDEKADIRKKTADICNRAKNTGFQTLLNENNSAMSNLWNTDIIAEGDKDFQRLIHSMIFYLLSSVMENTGFSIGPMGLATSGYYGHIFWDADTYMFPPLLVMHPGMAKSLVMFRVNALPAALENAKKNNYKGAMYPWESDETGAETTPYFAIQNAVKENHIVGDVALAQWQYYLATKDINWLKEFGWKVISATADFWVSRVNYNKEKDRYEIGKLVSVSEGMQNVNNETYTNSIAKLNLEIAANAANLLNTDKNPEWKKIAEKMFIPLDAKTQSHPIYENAPEGTKEDAGFWTSVAPLLSYPLQINMPQNVKRNDLLNAVKGLDQIGPGANMGSNFLPIIAAELGDDSLFNYTIEKTYKGYLRPPFNVLAETHTNQSINFLTGAGAFLQQVIFGYTGLRLTDKGFIQEFKPMLPRNITSLTLKNFTLNNKLFDISIRNNKLDMTPVK